MNINTVEYWNNRFKTNWEARNGLNQSKDFMECLINELPIDVKININKKTICDVGCGIATGTQVLADTFKNSKVIGVDFSDEAINQNKSLYPGIEFSNDIKECDICVSSNVLEHVDNPNEYIKSLMKNTSKYLIILVPYKEVLSEPEHIHSFDDSDFPEKLNGFNLIFKKLIKTKYWMFEQLLVVYEKNVEKQKGKKK